jgi:hypothetical protein
MEGAGASLQEDANAQLQSVLSVVGQLYELQVAPQASGTCQALKSSCWVVALVEALQHPALANTIAQNINHWHAGAS